MINPDDILIESYIAQPSSLRIAIVTETYPPDANGVHYLRVPVTLAG